MFDPSDLSFLSQPSGPDWAAMVERDFRYMTHFSELSKEIVKWAVESASSCLVVTHPSRRAVLLDEINRQMEQAGAESEILPSGEAIVFSLNQSVRVIRWWSDATLGPRCYARVFEG